VISPDGRFSGAESYILLSAYRELTELTARGPGLTGETRTTDPE
jgi:hypothetical protein